jgi:HTH-type transcriptional regulator/antitoxin HipB
MSEHARWERRSGRDGEAVRAGYDAAKRAYQLGQALRARRLELGMSQTQLAERAGMTQSAVSRLEAGGTVPTIGVLERLAAALSADLVVTLTPKPPDLRAQAGATAQAGSPAVKGPNPEQTRAMSVIRSAARRGIPPSR